MDTPLLPFDFENEQEFDSRLPKPVVVVVGGLVIAEAIASLSYASGVRMSLWLDEALTVNIARLPVQQIPGALKHDGAPPLFYVLLHFWMGLFGEGNFAVRMLPTAISALTLIATFLIVRRIWGTRIGTTTVAVLAGAPFFAYYSSECRMYALVMLESILLLGVLYSALKEPTRWRLGGVVAVVAAMLYTHYWSMYLLFMLALWLAWYAWRGSEKAAARKVLLAVGGGGVLFLPWVPFLLFQLAHTGTPWGGAQSIAIVVEIFGWFSDNQAALIQVKSLHAQVLLVSYLGLGALGMFGLATQRFTTQLDLRIQHRSRLVTLMAVGTVVVGSTISLVGSSAVTTRYGAVAFIPFCILLAFGISSFGDAWIRLLLALGLATVGVWSIHQYHGTARTQAPKIASALSEFALAGDVVAYCPDQLAPPTLRLLGRTPVTSIGYPHFDVNPTLINWVDYESAIAKATPKLFATRLDKLAGPHHRVWLGSRTYASGLHGKCIDLRSELDA
ncbi:MAG: glycosyltransferase family 39 protein, partial [Actinomycetota bacterium]